jgi:hypothetical protein
VFEDDEPNLKQPTADVVRLWAGATALQQAAAAIAIRPGADGDLRFSTAAGHCGEAADEILRAYRDVALFADVPRLEQDIARLPTVDAADHLLAAIVAAIHGVDIDNPGLLPIDMLAAGSAATWLALAHYAISGRLP